MPQESDFSKVDVFRMSKETGIRLTILYDILGLPYDSITHSLTQNICDAESADEIDESTEALENWLKEMGARDSATQSVEVLKPLIRKRALDFLKS